MYDDASVKEAYGKHSGSPLKGAHSMHMHMPIYMCTDRCIYVYTRTYTYMYIHTYTYRYMCTHAFIIRVLERKSAIHVIGRLERRLVLHIQWAALYGAYYTCDWASLKGHFIHVLLSSAPIVHSMRGERGGLS